jgi:hypothetical protein
MKKYTVIYNHRWQSGSHWHSLTKMARVELDSNKAILPQISQIIDSDDICFLFEGWPKMEGEE